MEQNRIYPNTGGRGGLFDPDPREQARDRELRRVDARARACAPSDAEVRQMNVGERDLKRSYAARFEKSWGAATEVAARRIEAALWRMVREHHERRPCRVENGQELAGLSIDLGAWPAFGRLVDAPPVASRVADCAQLCQVIARAGAEICLAEGMDPAGLAAKWRQATERLRGLPRAHIEACSCVRVREMTPNFLNSMPHSASVRPGITPEAREAAKRARAELDRTVAREAAAR